jgi:hypothetical protein
MGIEQMLKPMNCERVEGRRFSLNVMAARLNDQGVLTSRGKAGG